MSCGRQCRGVPGLVAHGDEVLPQLLSHDGRLLRHHRLLVHTHDQSWNKNKQLISDILKASANSFLRNYYYWLTYFEGKCQFFPKKLLLIDTLWRQDMAFNILSILKASAYSMFKTECWEEWSLIWNLIFVMMFPRESVILTLFRQTLTLESSAVSDIHDSAWV